MNPLSSFAIADSVIVVDDVAGNLQCASSMMQLQQRSKFPYSTFNQEDE